MKTENKVVEQIKEVGSDITKFLAALVGVGVGQVIVSVVPSTKIDLVDKVLPGAINIGGGILVATQFKDPHAKMVAVGLGTSGAASIVNKFTAGSTNKIVQKINQATQLPTVSLSGFGGFRGLGQTDRTLLGLGDIDPTQTQARALLGEGAKPATAMPVWMM